jgi:rhamnulokinase
VALPSYDTTSEITAIPVSKENKSKNWAYLNCGTWAMVGLISDCPIVSREGFEMGFGNEGGFAGRYHYLKNMTGLWIIQQCRKKWVIDTKKEISWKEIDACTFQAASKNVFLNVDDVVFEREIFDMPACVLKYLKDTGQGIPDGVGEMSICIYESLALKYMLILKKLEKITGRKMEMLHLVGGGSNNRLLCQWLADASGLLLIAGPQETTSTGNLLAQMVASRAAANIDEAREIMINSVELKHYWPDKNNYSLWQDKFENYLKILSLNV